MDDIEELQDKVKRFELVSTLIGLAAIMLLAFGVWIILPC